MSSLPSPSCLLDCSVDETSHIYKTDGKVSRFLITAPVPGVAQLDRSGSCEVP